MSLGNSGDGDERHSSDRPATPNFNSTTQPPELSNVKQQVDLSPEPSVPTEAQLLHLLSTLSPPSVKEISIQFGARYNPSEWRDLGFGFKKEWSGGRRIWKKDLDTWNLVHQDPEEEVNGEGLVMGRRWEGFVDFRGLADGGPTSFSEGYTYPGVSVGDN
jgi:hypothetical protein